MDSQLSDLKKKYPNTDWVNPENFHITVHFIGDIADDPSRYSKLKNKIEAALFDEESFYLYSSNADIFMRHKIIIYVSFLRQKKLEKIAQKIRDALSATTPPDFRYVPTLTFGKTRISSKQQYFHLKKTINRYPVDMEFAVRELVMLESIGGGKHPIYKSLAVFPLL